MIDLNYKIRILFCILSMILSVYGLEISILNVLTDFKCKAKIMNTNDIGILQRIYHEPLNPNSIVIVHVVDKNRYDEIANSYVAHKRPELAKDLKDIPDELIIFGIENCQDNEANLIYDVISYVIHPKQLNDVLFLEQQPMKQFYSWHEIYLHCHLFEKKLLRSGRRGALANCLNKNFPKMEFKSKRSNLDEKKEVKFYRYSPFDGMHYAHEEIWPVHVNNGVYISDNVNSDASCDNFLRKYPDPIDTFHILIVSGKEYDRIKKDDGLMEKFIKIGNEMFKENEIFFLMGCFNFGWSEIDVVRQIILKHSEDQYPSGAYKVFTVGFGLFRTFFQNPVDARQISPTKNDGVLYFANECNGGAWSELRTLEIYDFNTLNVTQMNITLWNGRYAPMNGSEKYSFSTQYPNKKFAFIVMDSTELLVDNVFSVSKVNEYAKDLNRYSDLIIFVIKASNFKLYDLHIIPEWVECHRGAAFPNQITILGGGTFDTSYQFFSPFYQMFYTPSIVQNHLDYFRRVLVKKVEKKVVFAFNIDSEYLDSQIQLYPIHTINGFYEPAVPSKDNMFETPNVENILFLIMKANKFHVATTRNALWINKIQEFRRKISNTYPVGKWAVYLIGLKNFGDNDSHLFAELVKFHTNDERPLHEFVHTFADKKTEPQPEYFYKDDKLTIIDDPEMVSLSNELFAK